LTHLPESLGQLAALKTLYITSCRSLTGLPESLGQLTALTFLDLSWCGRLTRLPESLGHLAVLSTLDLSQCHALKRLPFSMTRLPDGLALYYRNIVSTFPPKDVVEQGMPAIKAFLLTHHHPLKMLYLILSARRRRMRHPPAELWALIRDEYFMDLFV